MATNSDEGNYPYTSDHTQMWKTFCAISKWVIILTTISLVLMAAFLTGDHHVVRT